MPTPLPGLSAADARTRLSAGRGNRPPSSTAADYRRILARNLLTLFNAIVVPAAVALFLLGDYRGAWAVSAMAVANTLLALFQEVRAKRHLDRLTLLSEATVRVVRDGAELSIPSGDVVEGDLVRLDAGEPVVADGPVVEADALEIDEALLTGESDPVPRTPGEQLLSGSVCVAGRGAYLAAAVGAAAFAHRTAADARAYRHAPGPLQAALDSLVRVLTAGCLALCLLYLLLYVVRGFTTTELVQMIAATVTTTVPQGLVLMATLALTLGAVRLAGRGALVQQLAAVETTAAVDVLCTDKTGTLTTGELVLECIIPLTDTDPTESVRLFAAATGDDGNRTVQALRRHLGPPAEPFTVLDRQPFKSQTRTSSVTVSTGGGERTLLLGGPDALAPTPEVEARVRELLPTGLRLLLLAEVFRPPSPGSAGEGLGVRGLEPSPEQELAAPSRKPRATLTPNPSPAEPGEGRKIIPLALLGLRDELRPDAAAVLAELAAGGVRVKLVSGDHPDTVRQVALGLKLADPVAAPGSEAEALAESANVFGRVAPREKLALVRTLQGRGHRVAMVGDGVNDVLAIKAADLGVAMGAGTGASKTVAGLVLTGNQFSALPAALAEGRAVVGTVRRAAGLFLLKNVYAVALILLLVGLLGYEFPFLPQRVTLLNALTIGGPAALVLARRRAAADRGGPLAGVGRFVLTAGAATAAAGLAMYLVADRVFDAGPELRRTLLLAVLVFAGLGNAVRIAAGDRWVWAWAVISVPLFLLAVYLPAAADFFRFVPPTPPEWATAGGLAGAAVLFGSVNLGGAMRLLLLAVAALGFASRLNAADRPNFVFLFADDQRSDALGVVQREQGEKGRFPWFRTPHMDRLAAEGVRFRNAFVVNALCSPSRACFLTGRYSHANGIWNNGTPFLEAVPTYAAALRAAGYSTGYVGKWHMGTSPGRPGFDWYASFTGQGLYTNARFLVNGKLEVADEWTDDRSAGYAVRFLETDRAKDKPFVLAVGFKAPHGPFEPPKRLAGAFAGETSRPVSNLGRPPGFNPHLGKPAAVPDRPPVNLNYFRAIAGVDENVGKILAALERLKLTENTVVVYSSDNGFYLGEHTLADKRSGYDESLRVPMLVRYPKSGLKGVTRDDLVLNIDLAPTFLDLAGVPPLPGVHGQSWKPLLAKEPPATPFRTSFFYEYFRENGGKKDAPAGPGGYNTPTMTGVRTATHKLLRYRDRPEWTELFDLSADPFETTNLYAAAAHVAKRAELEAEHDRLAKQLRYAVPAAVPAEPGR